MRRLRPAVVIAFAFLTVLTGLLYVMLQPSQHNFSWAEESELDFVVGIDPTTEESWASPAVTFQRYRDAVASLTENVHGDYLPYVLTSRTGRRLSLEGGTSFPLFRELYVDDGYLPARGLHARWGTLWLPDDSEAVLLGHRLAGQIFGDPSLAVGQTVYLRTPGSAVEAERRTIVGVLASSSRQDPDLDPDTALVAPLFPKLEDEEKTPLHLFIRFFQEEEARRVSTGMQDWSHYFFGPDGIFRSLNSLLPERGVTTDTLLSHVRARRQSLGAFGALLIAVALFGLAPAIYWSYRSEKTAMVSDVAFGASRARSALALLQTYLLNSLAGGVVGVVVLLSARLLLEDLRLPESRTTPIVAAGVPLLVLTWFAINVRSLLMRPVLRQLGKAATPKRARILVSITCVGLTLALACSFTATQVFLRTRSERIQLESNFDNVYTLQTDATMIDLRAERGLETPRASSPVFTLEDGQALRTLPHVLAASVAQTLPSVPAMVSGSESTIRAVVADSSYLNLIALGLIEGDSSSCVLAEDRAEALRIDTGDTLYLGSPPAPCLVSGIMSTPPPLWRWLMVDMPELVAPPTESLTQPVAGLDGPFRSNRILLRIDAPEAVAAVQAWSVEHLPNAKLEILPLVPRARVLLAGLRAHAQLFLLLALIAGALAVSGVVIGCQTLVEAERSRILVDRALGLSLDELVKRWWISALALSAAATAAGTALAYAFSVSLYNALALSIPGLPLQEDSGSIQSFLSLGLLASSITSTALTLLVLQQRPPGAFVG
jgi:hypothetical protein